MIDKIIFNLGRNKYFFLAASFGVLVKEGLGIRIISAIIPAYNIYKYNVFNSFFYLKTSWLYSAMICIPFVYIFLAIILVIGNFVLYKSNNDYMNLFDD
ncbi:TPA: hypothetical protein ACX6QF_001213 [Photobacterium damselae]|uniref:hypothetical protein n=1 Tax=Photobacterium damselae TaxID=38293 RepID=UPI00165D6150|nr:hypothetical protein [Photobacterium damselae]WIH21099.1 hypothetical protein KQY33_18565 [Photobacterium damselae]